MLSVALFMCTTMCPARHFARLSGTINGSYRTADLCYAKTLRKLEDIRKLREVYNHENQYSDRIHQKNIRN